MNERSVLIIGAGIGGLATGCYAQMNGYRTRILEMHTRPGGLCTGWGRHGYVIDGCIHNLGGTSPRSAFHQLWRELGVMPRISFHAYEELVTVERSDGPPLVVYTDLDRLSSHMKDLSPIDAPLVDELIAGARHFTRLDFMGLALASTFERIASVASALPLIRYAGVTLDDFAKRFKDPFLRRAMPTLIYDWPQSPLLMFMTFLGRAHIGDFGWAKGGSAHFADVIAHRFRELGGEIKYQAKVSSILVENNRAVGVKLVDGTEERADIVVSNANGYATIFDMLGGRYITRAIRNYYANPEDRIEMGIHVSLGLNRDLSHEPHAIVLPLSAPVAIGNEMRTRLYVEPFGFDPTLAPKGKGVLKVVMATSYRMWEALAHEPERYHAEKQRIADAVIELLEGRFPGIARQVEVVDVATPITTKNFTGNGHGYRGGDLILGLLMGRKLSQTLRGLQNFYMVGQWAGAPGVPLVAAMGRDVARQICEREGRRFISSPVMSTSAEQPARIAA